jgi:predicted nucleic acid-binding protein
MRYLVDTNILLRLLQRNDPRYSSIRLAVRTLHSRGDELCCAPQNLVEFWKVSTRPAEARGGFGLTTDETDRRVRLLERGITILPESEALYPEWRRLVVAHSVSGVAGA